MLDIYVSDECEEKGISGTDKLALFYAIRHEELRKSLDSKLAQRIPELHGRVQNHVAQVVTGDKADS